MFPEFEKINIQRFFFFIFFFIDANWKSDFKLTWNDDLGLSLLPTSALNTDMYITIPTSINKPERETDLITWTVISAHQFSWRISRSLHVFHRDAII